MLIVCVCESVLQKSRIVSLEKEMTMSDRSELESVAVTIAKSISLDESDAGHLPEEEEVIDANAPFDIQLQQFFRKYFCRHQKLRKGVQSGDIVDENTPWHVRYRRLISFSIPIFIVWVCWFTYMGIHDKWDLFTGTTGALSKPRWMISLTMVFGSMVAGATSEGGAAIAFPVLTLTMGVAPPIARDFSYLIQSVGMTAAAFSIYFMKVKIEMKSILYCTLGGFAGVVYGLEEIAPRLEPAFNKMYFVCIWFAFAVSLYWLNYFHGGKVHDSIPHWEKGVVFDYPLIEETGIHQLPRLAVQFNWKAFTLLCFGFLGGIFSAMSGSGLDICSFALLCLLFRVDERVATPTSVVLMAINTVIAFLYREFKQNAVAAESYNIWLVCVPIVVVGAPMGAILSSHFHRAVFAMLIYIVDVAQFVGALVIIKPWLSKSEGGKTDKPEELCGTSAAILVAGALFFTATAFAGQYLEKRYRDENEYQIGKKKAMGNNSDKEGSDKMTIASAVGDMQGFELTSHSFDERDQV